jgi:hypothetical protein
LRASSSFESRAQLTNVNGPAPTGWLAIWSPYFCRAAGEMIMPSVPPKNAPPKLRAKSPIGFFSVKTTVSGSGAVIEAISAAAGWAGELTLSMWRWTLVITACASKGVSSENFTSGRRPIVQVRPSSEVSMDLARYGSTVPSGLAFSSES